MHDEVMAETMMEWQKIIRCVAVVVVIHVSLGCEGTDHTENETEKWCIMISIPRYYSTCSTYYSYTVSVHPEG